MDPQLLAYYNEELVYLREKAGEFAALHPKIARRLGMRGIEVEDPFVERLIEAFCLLSARTRIKLDAEFPRFTQRLLEVIYPNYVSPTPAMAVAELHPDLKGGDLHKGFCVPRGTPMFSRVPPDESTACEFRSTLDVRLWPLVVQQVRLTGAPPDIPGLERYVPSHVKIRGSLRITLRLQGEMVISELIGLNQLPVYLCGEEALASHLFEWVHTSTAALLIAEPGGFAKRPHAVVGASALTSVGMEPGEGALPLCWHTLHGHNLLHEYFACPQRFYFFALNGLAAGLATIPGKEVELVVLLTRHPGELERATETRHFSLYCTPIINLFPRRTDRLEVNGIDNEFHLVPDRAHPLDYEVFSVDELNARSEDTEPLTFRPLYQTLNQDEGNYGRYFSLRREARLVSDSMRKYGTRQPYIGSEVFISLVDQNEAPYSESIKALSVKALLTNRDLPGLVPRNGYDDLQLPDSIPVAAAGLVRPPSAPKPPFAVGEWAWRLIRQLGFNHIPLSNLPHREGAQALRDMLRLMISSDDDIGSKQIQSLVGSSIEPVTRRLPGPGPLVYGRGVQCTLTVDEDGFSGVSPFLFAWVLEHYLARHVAINSFTETVLVSMQRREIARWRPRYGSRNAV